MLSDQICLLTRENEIDDTQAIFEFKFALPWSSMNGRTDKPYKTVKTEQLIMSVMSLVGNVGGTLGMCVGFSFLGTSEWIMTVVIQLWRNFRERDEGSA